jgi:hypothetical protein
MGRETFDYYQRRMPVCQDRESYVFAAIRYHELGGEAEQYHLCMRAARARRAEGGRPHLRAAERILDRVLGWAFDLFRP